MEILYVDDDLDDFEFFSQALMSVDRSIKLVHAGGCDEAISFLENSIVIPNVIFVDLHLPKTYGLDCIRFIKGNERLSDIPIVVISETIPSHQMDGFNKLGICYSLSKTALISKLESALKEIIDSLYTGTNLNRKI